LTKLLQKRKPYLDCAVLEQATPSFTNFMIEKFQLLAQIPNWASARDIQTISKAIFQKVISTADSSDQKMSLTELLVLSQIEHMLVERQHRGRGLKEKCVLQHPMPGAMEERRPPPNAPPSIRNSAKTAQAAPEVQPVPDGMEDIQPGRIEARGPDVDEQTWQQLQHDKKQAEERDRDFQKLLESEVEARRSLDSLQTQETNHHCQYTHALQSLAAQNAQQAEIDEAKRRFEQERIQHELQRRAHEKNLAEIERLKKAAEEERRKEAQAQRKLREMGICLAGFRWVKQAGGYRCTAGGHFVSDALLGL
jgi:hypothetical protein